MPATFEDLIDEAARVDVSGWDFSWLDGRAGEQRPSWGYQRSLADRLHALADGSGTAALDIQTGGGEVLAGAAPFPRTMAATDSWPPNIAKATALLRPLGVVLVADPDEPPLPFADATFDLVSSRHPATIHWTEIARVLRPGGTYFAQHIGPDSNRELYEFFLGPQPDDTSFRHPTAEAAAARAAGLEPGPMPVERLRVEFTDIGAVVYFLRKVIWTMPDFSVERYRHRLRELHDLIGRDGAFVCHSTRTLVDARRPAS